MNETKCFSPYEGITVYDNVFSVPDQYNIFNHCNRAHYSIGWRDTPFHQQRYLHSRIDDNLWNKYLKYKETNNENDKTALIDMLDVLTAAAPFTKIDKSKITQSTINLDTIADSHYKHYHPEQNVILYYANIKWEDGWGGDTIFYDKYGKDVVFTSPYMPNRIIHFDGSIVHTFNPPTRIADKYRFSISTFYDKTNK